MSAQTTWKPHTEHGDLTTRSNLPESVYAFPRQRKEPLTDASHVKNALARFDQVEGVSDADRELAFANIKKAAAHYGVDCQGEELARPWIAPLKKNIRDSQFRGDGVETGPSNLFLARLSISQTRRGDHCSAAGAQSTRATRPRSPAAPR